MLAPLAPPKKNLPTERVTGSFAISRFCTIWVFNLLAIFVLPTTSSLAQDASPEDEVLRVSTDLLLFPIRVRDKTGRAVQGLKESDLLLKDRDRVTTGLYFSPGTDRVALVFALDESGSLRDIISQQRDAAIALFRRFSERSSIAVVRFSATPSLAASFDRTSAAAEAAFNFPAKINQRTAIFDAAAKAVTMFDQLPRVRSERRIVILISDGLDTASQVKPRDVINAAIDKRVSFYVIHLPLFAPRDGKLAVRSPAKGFRELAENTGGKYFLAGNAKSALAVNENPDLTSVFQAIEDDLKSQYLLGFYINEAARDGRKHTFSLGLLPRDTEYSVGRMGYSRKHDFFVNVPAKTGSQNRER